MKNGFSNKLLLGIFLSIIAFTIIHNHVYAATTFVDSKDVSGEVGVPQEIKFSSDGTKMYVLDSGDDQIEEYSCTTGFDVSTCSDAASPLAVGPQESVPQGLTFNSDGTKMFIIGSNGQDVSEYSSCTAFDVSTCSYAGDPQVKDVSGQDTDPEDLAFNSDGTKLFVLGKTGNTVDEYNCTAFDVSTCTSVDAFSLNAAETSPHGLAFSTDGTKMFVVGTGTDSVYEYTCTAFDVSTCSFVNSFSVTTQETDPKGITFSSNGLKMFVTGIDSRDVHEYTVDVAFDLFSTVSSSSKSIAESIGTAELPSFTKFLAPNEYPLTIQDTNYAYDDFAAKKTTTLKVGEPIQIKILASDDGGGSDIKRISLYMNLHGSNRELFQSNTAISYNNYGELTIRNSEGIIDTVNISATPDGRKQLITFDITFAKEMPLSDIIIQVVDEVNNSVQLRASDAIQVIKAVPIEETQVESEIQIPTVDPKLKAQLQLPNWIKQTGKSWSDGVISDNGFSKSLGYMIHNDVIKNEETKKIISRSSTYQDVIFVIPQYLKNNASWLENDLISDVEFVNAIQFLLDNEHISLKS